MLGMYWPPDDFVTSPDLTDEERQIIESRRSMLDPRSAYPDHIDMLYWLCRKSDAKNVVEIGVGHSTVPLLLACKRNGGRLFSTDINSTAAGHVASVRSILRESKYLDRWTFRFGIDSVEMGKQWNPKQWDGNDRGPIDFIFLDTSHEYEQTLKEIEIWGKLLKVGGWLVAHDVQSCAPRVLKAISEILINESLNYEYHHYPQFNGFGLLIRRL